MKALNFFVVLMLTGCATAEMVNRPGSRALANAPTNEAKRPGAIRYLNQGADFVIQTRRQDAYNQMAKACQGSYQILGEGPTSSGGVIMPVGNSYYSAPSEYWYISFQCN